MILIRSNRALKLLTVYAIFVQSACLLCPAHSSNYIISYLASHRPDSPDFLASLAVCARLFGAFSVVSWSLYSHVVLVLPTWSLYSHVVLVLLHGIA